MTKQQYYSPILFALAGTIAGIYVQSVCTIPILYLLCGCCATLIILGLALLSRSNILLKCFVSVFTFFTGALLLHAQNIERENLLTLIGRKKIDLIATVTDKGDWLQAPNRQNGTVMRLAGSETFSFATLSHQHLDFDFLCYTRTKTSLEVGDQVVVKNVFVKPPKNSSQSGNPSYDDYLLKEQVLCAIFTTGSYQCKLVSRPLFSLNRWIWNMRDHAYQTVKKKLSESAGDYFGLIFLGNKQQSSISELRTIFGYWGLSHYLARSGLHIVLFIMIWTFLLRLIPMHAAFKRCILILLCIAYDLLSWTSIPFARAYYAFLLMKGGELLHQQINYLHILSIVCLSILLFNPMQLFFLDFQLTFALTFTLVFISALFTKHKKAAGNQRNLT